MSSCLAECFVHTFLRSARCAPVTLPLSRAVRDGLSCQRWTDVALVSHHPSQELSETDSVYDTEKLSERIAKLSGGVAVIKVTCAGSLCCDLCTVF
eukprot:363564-Chlamydomonas_euryale.AAC.13